MTETLEWHRVASVDELPEGRVKTVVAGHKSFALSHFEGKFCALDNKCPHQGGPLGEGSIENGWLRCPWHGWDFHPCTGRSPGSHDDGVERIAVEVRDGEVFLGLPQEKPDVRTVSDVMVETMVNWGIKHVFGMVGHSNLGLAEALRKQEVAGNLTYIGIRHEGAASFACSAYAKLTGKPAACLGIAGPGTTNLITGLWDAKVDRAPVLALGGQVNTQVLGPGAFQEVDLGAALAPVSTWGQTVLAGSKHAELVNLALKHAILERDVTHLIFPDEVQVLPAEADAEVGAPAGRLPNKEIHPSDEALAQAKSLLERAKRPIVIVGHGARFSMDSIVELAERLNAPVITTFKGKGQISDSHPLGCGVLGRSGTPIASWFMNEADLLLVFGASFSDHTGISPKLPTIQVDFDQMALGKFHSVDVPMLAEVGVAARALLEHCTGGEAKVDQRPEIAERWKIWRDEKARRVNDDLGKGVNSAAIFAALTKHAPDNAVIAVDVGNNTYSFGRYFECTNQSVLMSGYLGSIGFGFPAAMGARMAAPDRPTIAVTGDGGFGQYLAEFTTAVKYGMNITHVLLNNSELGKISKEQRAGEWDVWQTSLHNPNFAEYAKNCGGFGIRVSDRAELDDAMTQAFAFDGPAIVEILTDADLI